MSATLQPSGWLAPGGQNKEQYVKTISASVYLPVLRPAVKYIQSRPGRERGRRQAGQFQEKDNSWSIGQCVCVCVS